jgi:predicted branched-subunit amino acid permease
MMSILVNSRHILMGVAFAPHLRHLPPRKVLPALFFMCDESWAMALADARKNLEHKLQMRYYLTVSFCLYITWVCFTSIGAFIGPVLGNVETYGFDMAFVAVFLVLLKGMWKGIKSSGPWIVSLFTACVIYLTIPGAWYVAGGTISGLIASFYWSRNHD